MTELPNYLSDSRPKFAPFEIDCGKIPAYRYKGNVQSELDAKTLTRAEAVSILEDMLVIRELEEMIVKLRSGAYEPIRDFDYRGPTTFRLVKKVRLPALVVPCNCPTTLPAPIVAMAKAWPRAPSPSAK